MPKPPKTSRKPTDPAAAAEFAAELRAWREDGGNLYALAAASGVPRPTIINWLDNGAPQSVVAWDKVMKIIRASRPRR